MKSRLPVLAAVALLSMLAGVLLYRFLLSDYAVDQNPAATTRLELHAIPLTDLDGRNTVVGDWQGKLLIVNFWAPWCEPCRREIPSLRDVHRQYAGQGVAVLGIAFDNESQVRRFAEDYRIDYPLFLAANRSAMYNVAFGNPSGSLPFTALIDRNLEIIFKHNGELSAQQLGDQLEKAL